MQYMIEKGIYCANKFKIYNYLSIKIYRIIFIIIKKYTNVI